MKSKRAIPAQVQPVVMLGWALLLDDKNIAPAMDSLTMRPDGIYIFSSEAVACRNMTCRADPRRFKAIKVKVILST